MMRSLRSLAVGWVGVSIALAGSVVTLVTEGRAGGASAAHAQPSLQPNGVDFSIHSQVDPNFCMEDVPAPDNPASEASMSQCAVRDGRHWTFARAADGSVVVIGGNTGNCLDFSGKVGSFVSMAHAPSAPQSISRTPRREGSSRRPGRSVFGRPRPPKMPRCSSPSAKTVWRSRSGG